MSILSNNKLKLEVKSTEAEVAKFISAQNQAEIVFIPSNNSRQEQAIFRSTAEDSSSNIFQVSASISTDTTPLATFKYTNTDLTTTAIIKGNLIIDGSALSLGTSILTDENDTSFQNVMPRSPYSNLISERYTKLLHSNIYQTSNTITTSINSLYNTLNNNLSNLFNIQRLFAGISFTSFSDADFDTRLLTRTTDNLQNGNINNFIINKTHPNQLVVNAGLNASNLITKSVDATAIYANKLYADASHLQNIFISNGIDGTTNTIPELPNASNLYYTEERVILIIDASNVLVSNYAEAAFNSVLGLNQLSENTNSNLILTASNEWISKIDISDYALSNAIYLDSLAFYHTIDACNLHMSNITMSFNTDVQNNVISTLTTTSNYILNTSNEIQNTLIYNIDILSTTIENLDATYQQDMMNASNMLIYAMQEASNAFAVNLQNTDSSTSNMMWASSNIVHSMMFNSLLNNSNQTSNLYYWFGVNIHSNLLETSNVFKNVFTALSDSLISDSNAYAQHIEQTVGALDTARQANALANALYITATFDALSNLAHQSYIQTSNALLATSNTAYEYHNNLLNKLAMIDIPDSCNYVASTSNDIRSLIFSNFMNQFADITADITAISDSVNERIDGLTTDMMPETLTSLYFTSNLFKSNIESLTLDDIRQGTQMKYITNNIYDDDLTISQQLSASNLTVSGTETVQFTNTINKEQLEIVSSAFNTALTIKQTDTSKNIIEVRADDIISLVATQSSIGVKNMSPQYALDVSGTLCASAFIASGQYLQNVNLTDKTTADLAEHPSRLYYTPQRAGVIISYCNIIASNYMDETSNKLHIQRDGLIASTMEYANKTSNVVSTTINALDITQSNYVRDTETQLQQYANTNLLNENQSNYVRRSVQILSAYMLNSDSNQSNYVRTTSNLTSNLMIRNHINISNYVYGTCNFNLGQQWRFSSNTSNYVRLTSNALINNFNAIIVPQINYSSNSANGFQAMLPSFDLNMSNYVRTMSNMMSMTRITNNMNSSNYISWTSNSIINYIKQSVVNLQTSGAGTVSSSATYINRWQEPTNYITNSTIATLPFNYITYNDGTAVGIGITNPTATLEIFTTNAQSNSIQVNNHIWAQTGIITSSDARIKKDIEDIDDDNALNQILAIEPKIYNYIDPRRQRQDVYGFIAQQVREVIPNAVRLQTAYIPDICCEAMLYDNVLMINEDIPVQLVENDRICIYYQREEYTLLIEDIYSENTYRVDNCFNLKGTVFIYGRIVNDFHTIDKDYIYTLNVCATQDLHRRQQSMYDRLYDLKSILGYNKIDDYKNNIIDNINAIAYIPEKIRGLNMVQSNLHSEYMTLYDVNRQLSDVVQTYDISSSLANVRATNEKLKADNMTLDANNSNLRVMMQTMSDRIMYIRSVLQKNNLI